VELQDKHSYFLVVYSCLIVLIRWNVRKF